MHRDVAGSDHKSSPPLISVIIPAYNTAPFIGETLLSVVRQTFTDFEIIVVNDGSPDTPALEEALAPFADANPLHRSGKSWIERGTQRRDCRRLEASSSRSSILMTPGNLTIWNISSPSSGAGGLAVVYANATTFGDPLRSGRLFMDMHPSSGDGDYRVARSADVQCHGLGAGAAGRRW